MSYTVRAPTTPSRRSSTSLVTLHTYHRSSPSPISSKSTPRHDSTLISNEYYRKSPVRNLPAYSMPVLPLPRQVAFEKDKRGLLPPITSSVGKYNYARYSPYDIYCGHREHVKIIVEYLRGAYGIENPIPETDFADHPSLSYFILQIILITNLPYSVLSATIVLLQRLRNILSESREVRPYRLFLAAFILAARECKKNDERSVLDGNGYWANLSQFPVVDIKKMTSQLKKKLGSDTTVYDSPESFLFKVEKQSIVGVLRNDAGGSRARMHFASSPSKSSTIISNSSVNKKSIFEKIVGVASKKGVGSW